MSSGYRIGRTVLSDGKVVSTVCLRPEVALFDVLLDPLLGRKSGPYETMVFPSEDDFGDIDCVRYRSASEARKGHKAVVAKWTAKIAKPKRRKTSKARRGKS